MADTTVKITLDLVDKAAQKALSDFISKTDTADKSLNKMKGSGTGTFNEIAVSIGKSIGVYDIFVGNLVANVATKALDTVASAASALFNTFIVDGVKAAEEQQDAINSLNQSLAATGKYSKESSEDIQLFAASLQATTTVGDDLILKNAAIIQSLGNLDKDGLKRATSAALDLSAALDKDLGTASEALGKAANGNITALTKMGLSIEKGATNAETFENALAALENRFGGAAASKLNTFAGAVANAKGIFSDLTEEVGNVIVKNTAVVEVIKTVGKIFNELTTDVQGAGGGLRLFIADGLIKMIDVSGFLVAALDTLVRSAQLVYDGFRVSFSGVGVVISKVLSLFSDDAKVALEHFTEEAVLAAEDVRNAFTKSTGLETLGVNIARMGDSAREGFNKMKDGAEATIDPTNNAKASVDALTQSLIKQKDEGVELANQLISSSESTQAKYALDLELLQAQRDAELITEQEFNLAKQELATQNFMTENELLTQSLQQKEITEQQYFVARDQLATQFAVNQAKRDAEDVQRIKRVEKTKTDEEKKAQELRGNNLRGTLGYISTLQQSSSRELFAIGKAAAIATAYIDGQSAVMKALASAPPPFNFALAGLVGAAVAVNTAKIVSSKPPGFEDGGIVPGNSFSGDNIAARLNSGEMVLNKSQQTRLFHMADGGSGGLGDKIDRLIGLIASKDDSVVVNIGGKTVVDVLRSELASGRTFA